MFVRLGLEFLLIIAALACCGLLYGKLVKSRRFNRVVHDLTDVPSEGEAALNEIDAALERAEIAADDLEEADCRRRATLQELRRKTRM